MKLLSRTSALSAKKKENDELVDTNIRLRKYESEVTKRLNNIRVNYDPEKLKKLQEFEVFCKDITAKKAKLLEEYRGLEELIELKRELYYGLIVKQDALDERMYQMKEEENKLKLREAFVVDLEEKWQEKQQ